MDALPRHVPLDVCSQEGKTAAGILHYALKGKEIYILLGRRDDSIHPYGDWCNFGGGSEEEKGESLLKPSMNSQESFLWQDAARESGEESNGIYAPHPRLLRHQPFIDVLTEKGNDPFLYRMYWQQVQYIAPEIFTEKIENSFADHNREYTDFVWVKASQILIAIQDENPVLPMDETFINIYGPLFETLSTPAGRQFLQHLTQRKTLKTLIKKADSKDGKHEYFSVRPYFNQVYHLWGTGTEDQFYPQRIKHPIVEVSQNPLKDIKTRMIENQQRDAQFSKDNLPPNTYELIEIKADHEDTVAHAVSAHGMAMMELKRRFSQPIRRVREENPSLWDMNCSESISRIHLRIILGKDYKTPEDFADAENPIRQADLANIREYFRRYTSTEYEQKNQEKNEFKRKIHLLDSDYEFFADVLSFEEENKNWPTFYHGASEDINNLWKSLTYLRELLGLKSFEELMALRGSDIYFKGAKTVQEVLELVGDCESPVTKAAMLFLNFTLFAGPHTTLSTSSSAEYLVNDHSVDAPDIKGIFLESLSLIGFSQPVYDYFHSLFEQYYKYEGAPWANSVLLAISQHPEDMDTYNYASSGNGVFHKIPSTLEVLSNIQAEYQRLQKEKQVTGMQEGFDRERERKKSLFPENRLWLHPARMMNSSHVKIKAFDRFGLSAENQSMYDREMRQVTTVLLGEWLAQKTVVLDGSFLEYPALKKLHHVVVKGVTGEELQEEFSSKGLIYLIHNGHLNSVKQYLENYPEVLKEEYFNPQNIIPSALKSNNQEFIDHFVKDIFNLDLSNFFSHDELLAYITYCFRNEYYHTLLYLLENCDFSKVEDSIKLAWARLLELDDSKSLLLLNDYLQVFYKIAPHLIEEVLNIVWQDHRTPEIIKIILDSPFAQPQLLLNAMGTLVYNSINKDIYIPSEKIMALLQKGVNLKLLHPLSQEPVGFLLKYFNCYFEPGNYFLIADLLDVRNKQGLTLLQELQKDYLENNHISNLYYALLAELKKANRNYAEESYPPFIEYFGNMEYPNFNSIRYGQDFILADYKVWVDALQSIKDKDEFYTILNRCPAPELYRLFSSKIDVLRNKLGLGWFDCLPINKLEATERTWSEQVLQLMKEPYPNFTALLDHINHVPTQAALHKFFGSLLETGEQYIDLLPTVLEKLYPTKGIFISEKYVASLKMGGTLEHPIVYSLRNGMGRVVEILINFIGIENLSLINIKGEFDTLIGCLSEDQLEKLYENSPGYFADHRAADHFQISLFTLPPHLKREVVLANLDKLKMIAERRIPYFWCLLQSDSDLSLVKELVELDPSLLYLKGTEGIDLLSYLPFFPKNLVTRFLKDRLTLGS